MLNSKQRAYLTGLSNNLDVLVQIGKYGVSPETVEMTEEVFNTHELIKGSVLKTSPEEPRDAAVMLAERTHAEFVRVIGRKFILYKPFKEDPEIKLP